MTFSFLDMDLQKPTLNEEIVSLADYFPVLFFLFSWPPTACQIQRETNTNFACAWLSSFALDAPTEKETKDLTFAIGLLGNPPCVKFTGS